MLEDHTSSALDRSPLGFSSARSDANLVENMLVRDSAVQAGREMLAKEEDIHPRYYSAATLCEQETLVHQNQERLRIVFPEVFSFSKVIYLDLMLLMCPG